MSNHIEKSYTTELENWGTVEFSYGIHNEVGQIYLVINKKLEEYQDITKIVRDFHRKEGDNFPQTVLKNKVVQYFVLDEVRLYIRTINLTGVRQYFKQREIDSIEKTKWTMDKLIKKDFKTVRLDALAYPNTESPYLSRIRNHEVVTPEGTDESFREVEARHTLESIMEHAGLNDLQKQIIRFKYETPHITNVEIGNRLGEGRKRIDRNQQYAQRDMERYLLANPEEAKALTEGTIPVRDVYYNGNKVLGSVTGSNLEELLCKTFPYAHEMYRIKNPTSKYNYKIVKFHRPELKESEGYTIYSVNVLEENGKYGVKVVQEGVHYNDKMYRSLQRKKSFERTTI